MFACRTDCTWPAGTCATPAFRVVNAPNPAADARRSRVARDRGAGCVRGTSYAVP
jgi:hypothetical protein